MSHLQATHCRLSLDILFSGYCLCTGSLPPPPLPHTQPPAGQLYQSPPYLNPFSLHPHCHAIHVSVPEKGAGPALYCCAVYVLGSGSYLRTTPPLRLNGLTVVRQRSRARGLKRFGYASSAHQTVHPANPQPGSPRNLAPSRKPLHHKNRTCKICIWFLPVMLMLFMMHTGSTRTTSVSGRPCNHNARHATEHTAALDDSPQLSTPRHLMSRHSSVHRSPSRHRIVTSRACDGYQRSICAISWYNWAQVQAHAFPS